MLVDSCHSSQNSSEPTGGMTDEVIPIYTHICAVISDVCKPHWSSECYINKCGVTFLPPGRETIQAVNGCSGPGGSGAVLNKSLHTSPHHCLGKDVVLKAVCTYSDATHLWGSDPVDPGIKS